MIYVASSWRNEFQPIAVQVLRAVGKDVYDFRNPTGQPDDKGFHWSEIDPDWKQWTAAEYRAAVRHPIAEAGFGKDLAALNVATAGVLVQPCGRSAHLEIGYLAARGVPTCVWFPRADINVEPELMLKVCNTILIGGDELVFWASDIKRRAV